MMRHPNRVRKPSQRILMNTAFSMFKNTADDPVLLDEDDSVAVPAVKPTDDKEELENPSEPMEVVVDLRSPSKAVKLSEDYLDSWERDSLTDTQCLLISTGNENTSVGSLGSDKATTSGKGRMRKGSSKRADTNRGAANHETKANEHMPTMMKEGSSRSAMPRVNKRERTELEDGCFGLLPLTDIICKCNCTMQSNASKGEDSSGNQQEHESSETDLLNTIVEKMASIKRLKQEADEDIHYGLTNFEHKDRFISLRYEMDNLFNSTASGERTPNTMKKTGLVCESMRVSEENSKAMKFLNIIEPPGFDLGISLEKDVQTEKTTVVGPSGSGVTKDKEKGKLFDDNHAPEESGFIRGNTERRFHEVVSNIVVSDSSEKLFEEKNVKKVIPKMKEEHGPIAENAGITHNHPPMDNIRRVRPKRRTVKPGDPLKSPYVDFNVSAEDKRAHEWALSIFGGKVVTMFRTNDCIHIFRTGLETLARTNMNVSPSVIDGWASILNYEECFRNQTSISLTYKNKIFKQADPLLRMQSVDENTQYRIFQGKLAEAERYRPKLMEMRDIDLNDMKKEIDRFTSLDPDIKSQILRQACESRFERLEF
ncbi:hypothetical protein L6452_33018 [Arctium lappa]|uniref:Uncharacterized protein n=1 Tax=Arctium lappa TaxID=4217 RepID=A0ACB8Z5A7_ARCLA|nr:hypothetical protein L6452_33018 [Arctium lappa]